MDKSPLAECGGQQAAAKAAVVEPLLFQRQKRSTGCLMHSVLGPMNKEPAPASWYRLGRETISTNLTLQR